MPAMATDGGDQVQHQSRAASAFWWRLTDNAFRHLVWFLVPVLLFAALGLMQASKALQLYESAGVLSASSNPLVPDQIIPGGGAQYWESTAAAASRTINEQLRTDKFMEDVAANAGLGEVVASGFLELDIVRSSVWSFADGTSLVQVHATWADPQTAHALVQATIVTYQAFLGETVASDSSEAVAFYTGQLDQYQAEVERSEQALVEYVSRIPDDGDPSLAESLQIQRLTDDVRAAEGKVAGAQDEIEGAQLVVAQSKSEAGRSLTVIDAPRIPGSPESTLVNQAMTVVAYLLLGVVIAIGALLVSTVLDQSVSSPSDVLIDGVALVATVPVVSLATHVTRSKRRSATRSAGRKRTRTDESQPVGV